MVKMFSVDVSLLTEKLVMKNDGLPRVHFFAKHVPLDVFAVGASGVGPVVVGIHLGIEHELGQQERGSALRHPAIEFAGLIGACRYEHEQHLLQFVHDVAIGLAARPQFHLSRGGRRGLKQRHASIEVHGIEQKHGPQRTHLGAIGLHFVHFVLVLLPVELDAFQRAVAGQHFLHQIVPCIARAVGLPEAVQIQCLPVSAVVPVGPAGGHDGFVGGERVQVVHAMPGALQPLAIAVAAQVAVNGRHSVQVQVVHALKSFVGHDAVVRVFF